MTKGQLDYANFRARRIFEDWNDVTGAIPRGSSLYYELLGVLEDAVHCGAQGALDILEPLESEPWLTERLATPRYGFVDTVVKGVRFGTESCAGEKVSIPATSIASAIPISSGALEEARKDFVACFGANPWEYQCPPAPLMTRPRTPAPTQIAPAPVPK